MVSGSFELDLASSRNLGVMQPDLTSSGASSAMWMDVASSGVSGAVGPGLALVPSVSNAMGSGLASTPSVSGAVGTGLAPAPSVSGAVGTGLAPAPSVSGVVDTGLAPAPAPGSVWGTSAPLAPGWGLPGAWGRLPSPPLALLVSRRRLWLLSAPLLQHVGVSRLQKVSPVPGAPAGLALPPVLGGAEEGSQLAPLPEASWSPSPGGLC